MQRLIFVNRFFHPDHSATSQILCDLAFHLAEAGFDVQVLASRQIYDDPSRVLPTRESVRGVKVHRVWATRFGRGRLLPRAVDYLTFYLSATVKLARLTDSGTVVIAETDPPLLSVPCALVTWLKRAALVNWTQDLFPEIAQSLHVPGIALVAPVLRRLRNLSLKLARTNVVLGEGMAARLRAEGVEPDKIEVIHNWSPAETEPSAAQTQPFQGVDKFVSETGSCFPEAAQRPFRLAPRLRGERPTREARPVRGRIRPSGTCPSPADADVGRLSPSGRGADLGLRPHLERGAAQPAVNPLRAEWDLGQKFVVGYSGNFGRAHDFATVLDAAAALRDLPDVHFLFVGAGAQRAWVETRVAELGLTNVSFQPYQPLDRLALSLSVPDVHLVSLRPELEGLIVPSKFYSVLAAGKPVLFVGDSAGEMARRIEDAGCGRTFSVGAHGDLAAAIRELAGHTDQVVEMGTRARVLWGAQFRRKYALAAWERVVGSCR